MIILTSLFLPLAIIYLGLGKPMEIINLSFYNRSMPKIR